MREFRKWYEMYRDISIEVVHWRYDAPSSIDVFRDGNWCAYINLHSQRHPEILGFDVEFVKYTDRVPFFNQFDFHGGVTFSEVTRHREDVRMKIGCDYQHYGDEGMGYTVESVMQDMRDVVDQYREKFPEAIKSLSEGENV